MILYPVSIVIIWLVKCKNIKYSLQYVVLRCIFAGMKTEMIPIRVDSDLKKKLKDMADKDRRTLSDFIRLQLEKLTDKK